MGHKHFICDGLHVARVSISPRAKELELLIMEKLYLLKNESSQRITGESWFMLMDSAYQRIADIPMTSMQAIEFMQRNGAELISAAEYWAAVVANKE